MKEYFIFWEGDKDPEIFKFLSNKLDITPNFHQADEVIIVPDEGSLNINKGLFKVLLDNGIPAHNFYVRKSDKIACLYEYEDVDRGFTRKIELGLFKDNLKKYNKKMNDKDSQEYKLSKDLDDYIKMFEGSLEGEPKDMQLDGIGKPVGSNPMLMFFI